MIHSMYPILARYGALFIYSYTVVMALGIMAALALTYRLSKQSPCPQWFDAWLAAMAAALVGGRIGFIVWRWDYFQQRPAEIWQIWQGGFSYTAALLSAILGLLLWSTLTGRPFYRYASLFAPAFLLITLFGWLACWLEGCAYGQETVLGLLAADLPDDYGVFAVRYRTQLLGFLLTLMAFIFILWYRKKRLNAALFLWALAAVSLVHLLTSLLRGDPTFIIGGLRLDTLLNGLFLILALGLLQYERYKL